MSTHSRAVTASSTASTSARTFHQPIVFVDKLQLSSNLFSGPDGIRHHRVKRLDDKYVGIGRLEKEKTSQLDYITMAPKNTPFPKPRHERIGEVGWPVKFFKDNAGY